ncbi:MAG: hypothetical protein AOA65_1416 [Candidatus Bathyarchaeota archaeon BA1]|nr:MAG: hypothetical protein AOA65_1416 [Candidatus Bathyarchaeota archaeon BA1]
MAKPPPLTFMRINRLMSQLEVAQKYRPILERIHTYQKEKLGVKDFLYYYRVQKNCGGSDTPLWSMPIESHAIYPYLQLEHRQNQAQLFMRAIRDFALRAYKLRGPYWMRAQKLHELAEKLQYRGDPNRAIKTTTATREDPPHPMQTMR